MCFGGGSSKTNVEAPPPSKPTTFGYDQGNSQAQRNHNAVVAAANQDTLNSSTSSQTQQPQTFGAELGAPTGQ